MHTRMHTPCPKSLLHATSGHAFVHEPVVVSGGRWSMVGGQRLVDFKKTSTWIQWLNLRQYGAFETLIIMSSRVDPQW